jgi:hypothetical protein
MFSLFLVLVPLIFPWLLTVLMVASCGKTMVKGRASYEVGEQLSIEIWSELWIYDLFLPSRDK